MNTKEERAYWSKRYQERLTGWDIGYPSTPIKSYVDQLEDKQIKILIPGAGNAYEAEYLFKQGFKNTYIIDIAEEPLSAFRKRVADFPEEHLILGNFFEHADQYELIIEQTFFCSFPPTHENRDLYFKTMAKLLQPSGKLVGLWFDIPLSGDMIKRPFGGNRAMYIDFAKPYLSLVSLEPCYNSIPPRANKELFGIFQKTD